MAATAAQRAVAAYLADRLKRGEIVYTTARQQGIVLRRFAAGLGERDVCTVTRRDIDRHMRERAMLRPSSRRVELGTLNAFFVWCIRNRRMRRNPLDGYQRPKARRSVPAALPRDQVEALLRYVEQDARLNAMVWAMLGLGLRRAEVAGVHVEDWDRRGGVLRVVGKGGHERLLPVFDRVERAWLRYLAEMPASSGPLFRSMKPPHGPLKVGTVGWIVTAALEEVGIKAHAWDRVCGHALRHTALSDTLDACGDLRVVMEMAGHSSLAVTSVYQRRSQVGELRAAMERRPY